MQKTQTITQNYLFRRLYRHGRPLVGSCIALYYKRTKSNRNRLGVTATKKIGGAVQRNRARRVILEAYRLLEPDMPGGLDLVIVARSKATRVKMQTVRAELAKMLRQIETEKPGQNPGSAHRKRNGP